MRKLPKLETCKTVIRFMRAPVHQTPTALKIIGLINRERVNYAHFVTV